MKFLSVFTIDPSAMAGPPDPAMFSRMDALIKEMTDDGTLVDTGGRMPTGLAMRVRRSSGTITVTDGPFAESKEIVGGFALFNATSKEHMIALSERFLEVAGNGTCEIVEISETPNH